MHRILQNKILIIFFCILIINGFIYSDVQIVRVIVTKANIRSAPDLKSAVISQAAMGTVLEVIEKSGQWYKVKLPPDPKGTIISGYIHESIVEIFNVPQEMTKDEAKEAKEYKKEKDQFEEIKHAEILKKSIEPTAPIKSEDQKTLLQKFQTFNEGNFYFSPQVGVNSWTIPFGIHLEYGYKENIGVGSSILLWLWSCECWSNTLICLSGEMTYHFTQLKVDKLDLYAGGGLGFAIYSWRWKPGYEMMGEGGSGHSGILLHGLIGARYYLSPRTAVHVRILGSLLNWAGAGGTLGISFNL